MQAQSTVPYVIPKMHTHLRSADHVHQISLTVWILSLISCTLVLGLSTQNNHRRTFQEIRLIVHLIFKGICEVKSPHLCCALFTTYSHLRRENTQGHMKHSTYYWDNFFLTFNLKLTNHFRETEIFLRSCQNIN